MPIQEDRWNDTNLDDTATTQQQLATFTEQMQRIESLSQSYETNFYVGHRPILGIGCNASQIVTLDWTLQQSLGPTTLNRINGLITGHMQ